MSRFASAWCSSKAPARRQGNSTSSCSSPSARHHEALRLRPARRIRLSDQMDWDALWPLAPARRAHGPGPVPLAIAFGRWLAVRVRGKAIVEAPLRCRWCCRQRSSAFICSWRSAGARGSGQAYERLFGHTLVFTFEGLLVASVIVNIPFAVQPVQRAFEAIGRSCARRRRAAACRAGDASADRAAARLAGHPDRHGADLRPHAWRVRRRADGRRQHPRRDQDHRHRHLRPRPGLRRCGGRGAWRRCCC